MILSVKHCGLMWGTRARGGEERRPGRDPLMKVIFCHAESESESRSVVSDSLRPYGLYSPWNSPGQSTGVGSLSLLQGDLPNPGIEARSPTLQAEPRSPALQVDSLPAEPQGKPK